MNIVDTESYLIYHHWFSEEEINNMSYLDFTILVERIFKLYEEDEKRKAEETKQKYKMFGDGIGNLMNIFQ